ncbi:MAG: hypothetical protein AB9883_04465 [Acidaminococcaceae bacterium]
MSEQENQVIESNSVPENSNKKRNIIVIAIIAIIASLAFYFLYWIKTPQYSLGIIKESIQKHDLVKFEKHVDLNNMYTRAFDDLIMATLSEDDKSNPFIFGIASMMKNIVVPTLTDETKKFVETGSFEVKKTNSKNDGQQIADNMKNKSGVETIEYNGVESTSKEGKIAVVNIKITDKQVKKSFIIKLKMRELDDGTWQLTEISNLKEYLKEHEEAATTYLAELNKPVQDKIDGYVKFIDDNTQFASNVYVKSNGNPFFASYKLHMLFYLQIPNKNVTSIHGAATITDSASNVVSSGSFSATANELNNNIVEINRSKDLNQFIANDKKIINMDTSSLKVNIKVNKIALNDGTIIELIKELPPVK